MHICATVRVCVCVHEGRTWDACSPKYALSARKALVGASAFWEVMRNLMGRWGVHKSKNFRKVWWVPGLVGSREEPDVMMGMAGHT